MLGIVGIHEFTLVAATLLLAGAAALPGEAVAIMTGAAPPPAPAG